MRFEEDIEAAHVTAKSMLGPDGRMLERTSQNKKNLVMNARVRLQSDRTLLWYGDVDVVEDKQSLANLATALGESLDVETEDGRLMHSESVLQEATA